MATIWALRFVSGVRRVMMTRETPTMRIVMPSGSSASVSFRGFVVAVVDDDRLCAGAQPFVDLGGRSGKGESGRRLTGGRFGGGRLPFIAYPPI